MRPLISFVIPALNEEANIAHCIYSIQKEILATGVHGEIIVVDNGSDDGTKHEAERMGALVVDEPLRGTNQARQSGYEFADGHLVAFIDADVRLPVGWITKVVSHFAEGGVACVAGPYKYEGPWWFRAGSWLTFQTMVLMNKMGANTMMGGNYVVSHKALWMAGGHNTDIKFYGDDSDTAKRLAKVGEVRFDMKLAAESSNRRFRREGYAKTLWNYWAVGFLGIG